MKNKLLHKIKLKKKNSFKEKENYKNSTKASQLMKDLIPLKI